LKNYWILPHILFKNQANLVTYSKSKTIVLQVKKSQLSCRIGKFSIPSRYE